MTVMTWTVRPTFRGVEDDIGNALTAWQTRAPPRWRARKIRYRLD
jgi:hypothetical protein